MLTTNKHSGKENLDIRRAKKLAAALTSKSRLTRRNPNITQWADEFRKLRQTGKKITPVLKWYCRNVGKQYIPDIRSAGSFRKRFPDLERSMSKSDPKVKITKEARLLADEHFFELPWPGDSYSRLPEAIQLSANAHGDLMYAAETMVEPFVGLGFDPTIPARQWPDKITLATHMLADHGDTTHFIVQWFQWVFRKVSKWPDWDGSFRPFIFKPDHKRFLAIMHESARQHVGAETIWDELVKELA